MKYKALNNGAYMIRLDPNDEIIESLMAFCSSEGVKNAIFWGIGSIENPTLAHYRLSEKKYTEKIVKGVFELLSVQGNIALFEEKPLVHAHCVISDEEMKSYGGHVVNARVSATAEIHLVRLDTKLSKSYNNEIGLKLFNFDDES